MKGRAKTEKQLWGKVSAKIWGEKGNVGGCFTRTFDSERGTRENQKKGKEGEIQFHHRPNRQTNQSVEELTSPARGEGDLVDRRTHLKTMAKGSSKRKEGVDDYRPGFFGGGGKKPAGWKNRSTPKKDSQ